MAPSDGALVAGITSFIETPADAVAMVNKFADFGADQVCHLSSLHLVHTYLAVQIKLSMSGEEITEHLRAEESTFPDELVAAAVEVSFLPLVVACSNFS